MWTLERSDPDGSDWPCRVRYASSTPRVRASAHRAGAKPAAPVRVRTRSLLGVAFPLVMNTYNGRKSVTYYGEESKNPGRTVPRSLCCGILGVTALYLIINLAMSHVFQRANMAQSILPMADVAGIVFGSRGAMLVTDFGVSSIGAIASLFAMSASRMTFALARDGHLPVGLSKAAANGVPMPAIVFIAAIAALFPVTGSYVALVTRITAVTQLTCVAAFACIFVLRKRTRSRAAISRSALSLVSVAGSRHLRGRVWGILRSGSVALADRVCLVGALSAAGWIVRVRQRRRGFCARA